MAVLDVTWQPKPDAPAFFYFIPEDIANAFQYIPEWRTALLSWIALQDLGIPLGPQDTGSF